jgi:hypothetical protein
VDLERHRVVGLLPERSADSFVDFEARSRRDRADREHSLTIRGAVALGRLPQLRLPSLEREALVLSPEALTEENLFELEAWRRNDRRLSKVRSRGRKGPA